MAIVKMSRLTAVALTAEKQALLDEIVKTGSVQIGECEQIENSSFDSSTLEKLLDDVSYLENVTNVITSTVDFCNQSLPKDKKVQVPSTTSARPRYELNFDDFKRVAEIKDEVFERGARILELDEKASEALAEKNRIENEMSALKLFLPLEKCTNFFADTAHAYVAIGTMPRENFDVLCRDVENEELFGIEKLNENATEALVSVYCHKSLDDVWNGLSKYGFRRADIPGDVLPRVLYAEKQAQANTFASKAQDAKSKIVDEAPLVEKLKLVGDWISLQAKELEAGKGMNTYGYTFAMSAYLPSEDIEKVQTALTSVTENIILQFDEIGDEEFAPTLCRNNKIVTPFESVTNMYMPPNYHEPDPNPIMSIFYFLIFGLMTADVGYGLVLVLAGLFLSSTIKQNTGLKQLSGLIGICGIATVVWGFLFGSFFSVDMTNWLGESARSWYPILPSPSNYPIVTMALSLVLGILHLMLGVFSNFLKQVKQHHVADGIIDNLPWIVFFVGLIMLAAQPACGMICDSAYEEAIANGELTQTHLKALVTFRDSAVASQMFNIGLYTIVGALVFVALTAGRHNKGLFGKLKGGFGGVYGVINYFSDVVSYVRIFGLMLSGAVFGSIINTIVDEMIFTNLPGIVGYAVGGLILVPFHVFNLALAVLGAYVHNARLQYVEYFGKFYDGEGQLFTPLGSDLKHTLITH